VIQRGRGGERTSIKKELAGLFPMKFKSECKAKFAWRISIKTFICSSSKVQWQAANEIEITNCRA